LLKLSLTLRIERQDKEDMQKNLSSFRLTQFRKKSTKTFLSNKSPATQSSLISETNRKLSAYRKNSLLEKNFNIPEKNDSRKESFLNKLNIEFGVNRLQCH
jgi:hypothetical protein